MRPGIDGYEVVFYYDELELILEGPELYSKEPENKFASVISPKIFSAKLIATSNIRVGDQAASAITRYRCD